MWIAKGTLLGAWLFSFGTIAYLYLALYRHLQPQTAVGVDLITHMTIQNVLWWTALATCLAIGLFITRSWSGRPALWIALVATELFPVGLLVLFLMVVSRMKAMAGK
jgi:hypothetical protein